MNTKVAMVDEERVQQLVDEILDTENTPEEVCAAYPELLAEVQRRWRQLRLVSAELEALFPVPAPSTGPHDASRQDVILPHVPGYEVEAVLGRGGMGIVFRARQQSLNRVVALKMVLAGAYAGLHERERFQREAEAVAVLRHPNIVQIHDVGDADGRPYFTMEYVEGGSLSQSLAGTPQPARQSAALLITLAAAVQAAHQSGIVHRDLKPANILLTADGTPKISDFGLARRLDGETHLTGTGIALGTPSYMAPEQARGHTLAGPAVDTYALGAILYEMLTGRPPFRAETTAETIQQVISQEPVRPSRLNGKVPRDLETICLKCLKKEARQRYASAAALAKDLQSFLHGEAIVARPEGVIDRMARRIRRRPGLAAAVALVTLLTVSLIGGGLWTLSERSAAARGVEVTEKAADDDLKEMAELLEKSTWHEAKAAMERAKGRLGNSHAVDLRRRLDQGSRDLELVAALEEIRLRLSDGRGNEVSLSPEKMYAEAFRNYGIDLMVLEPAEAAGRIRDSAVRETLLAFLHDWLYWVSDENRPQVWAAVDLADDDEWRRAFRAAIAVRNTDPAKIKALAIAPEAAVQPPVILSGLCGSLLVHSQRAEALALLNEAQGRHPEDFWINYLLGHFWDQERPEHAAGYFRAAVAIRPTSDQAYAMLGKALRNSGDSGGAIAAFRKALELNPDCALGKEFAMLLAERGGLQEARRIWGKFLERNPADHNSWYGYAQLCLFLGDPDAYGRARKALLDHYGNNIDDWIVAERTSLACLLLPVSVDEAHRVDAMVDKTLALGPKPGDPDHAYVAFVKGLAEYRKGRAKQAIPLLQESAKALSNRAGPRLVIAMAQFQSGSKNEARATLMATVAAFNWKEPQGELITTWVSHVLRREAERLILGQPVFHLHDGYGRSSISAIEGARMAYRNCTPHDSRSANHALGSGCR
jgi:serine/threonine-protein kinase